MSKHTIVFAGNGTYLNRGCEAIVRGTTKLLRDQWGDCKFISAYFQKDGSRDHQIETDPNIEHRPFPSFQRYSYYWLENALTSRLLHRPSRPARVYQMFQKKLKGTNAEAIIMLGGDNYGLTYSRPDVFFTLNQVAIDHRIPFSIWGASVGPFSSDPTYEKWAAKELQEVTLICVRETESLDYLTSIGVTDNVILSADPAFVMSPSPVSLPSNIENLLSQGCIGLNLSPLLYQFMKSDSNKGSRKAHQSQWAHIAAQIVDDLLSHFSLPILLIPHVTTRTNNIGRNDYLFMNRIRKILEFPTQLHILKPTLNAAQTKWVIGRTRVFAGARTHSTIAAISSGVPTICIGYSMKARGIAKDTYGHTDWLIDHKDLIQSKSILGERLQSLITHESEIRHDLQAVLPIFLQRAVLATQMFINLITS